MATVPTNWSASRLSLLLDSDLTVATQLEVLDSLLLDKALLKRLLLKRDLHQQPRQSHQQEASQQLDDPDNTLMDVAVHFLLLFKQDGYVRSSEVASLVLSSLRTLTVGLQLLRFDESEHKNINYDFLTLKELLEVLVDLVLSESKSEDQFESRNNERRVSILPTSDPSGSLLRVTVTNNRFCGGQKIEEIVKIGTQLLLTFLGFEDVVKRECYSRLLDDLTSNILKNKEWSNSMPCCLRLYNALLKRVEDKKTSLESSNALVTVSHHVCVDNKSLLCREKSNSNGALVMQEPTDSPQQEEMSQSSDNSDPTTDTEPETSSSGARQASIHVVQPVNRALVLRDNHINKTVLIDAILKRGNDDRRQLIKAPSSIEKVDWYSLSCTICGLLNHSRLSVDSKPGLILIGVDPSTQIILGMKMNRKQRDLFLQTFDDQLLTTQGFLRPRLMMHNLLNTTMIPVVHHNGIDSGRRLIRIEVRPHYSNKPYVMARGNHRDVAFTVHNGVVRGISRTKAGRERS